jgi:D-alanine--poly(phosphoribitol) ligase subunit 1
VKINGYRVELAEVEYYSSRYLNNVNVLAMGYHNRLGDTELGLAIEIEECDIKGLTNYMKSKLPFYMIPVKIKLIKDFPLNRHGKIDRKTLSQMFEL